MLCSFSSWFMLDIMFFYLFISSRGSWRIQCKRIAVQMKRLICLSSPQRATCYSSMDVKSNLDLYQKMSNSFCQSIMNNDCFFLWVALLFTPNGGVSLDPFALTFYCQTHFSLLQQDLIWTTVFFSIFPRSFEDRFLDGFPNLRDFTNLPFCFVF